MPATDATTPEPPPDAGVDELQADISRTREELGQTVAALSDKFDVKGRAQQKVADTKGVVAQRTQELTAKGKENPAVPVGIVVGLLAAAGAVLWLRRRNR